MTNYSHRSIFIAYPNVKTIDDQTAYDWDGNVVSLDPSKIAEAQVQVDQELVYHNFCCDRQNGIGNTVGYPTWQEQMGMLYDDMKNGTLNTSGQWYVGITSVKNNIPKPS